MIIFELVHQITISTVTAFLKLEISLNCKIEVFFVGPVNWPLIYIDWYVCRVLQTCESCLDSMLD
jgi:hypothetical protein